MTLDEVKRELFSISEDVLGNDMVDLYEAHECCDTSFNIGYNKAIDDFSESVKNLIADSSVIRFKDIDEIIEQLKGGY